MFLSCFQQNMPICSNDINVWVGFQEANLKNTKSALQKKSHGYKSLTKDVVNGRRHAFDIGLFH